MAQSKNRKTTQGATSPVEKSPVAPELAVQDDLSADVSKASRTTPVNSFQLRNNTHQKLVVSVHMTADKTQTISLLPKETVVVKGTYADRYVRKSLAIYGDQLSLVE